MSQPGALDSDTSVQIMEILKEISRDKLIIMVTHNPELAAGYAGRVIRLKDGRITDDSAAIQLRRGNRSARGKAPQNLNELSYSPGPLHQ